MPSTRPVSLGARGAPILETLPAAGTPLDKRLTGGAADPTAADGVVGRGEITLGRATGVAGKPVLGPTVAMDGLPGGDPDGDDRYEGDPLGRYEGADTPERW